MERGQNSLQAHFTAHIIDGLFKQLESLAAGRAGLHGTGEIKLLKQLLQLLVQGQILPVCRH